MLSKCKFSSRQDHQANPFRSVLENKHGTLLMLLPQSKSYLPVKDCTVLDWRTTIMVYSRMSKLPWSCCIKEVSKNLWHGPRDFAELSIPISFSQLSIEMILKVTTWIFVLEQRTKLTFSGNIVYLCVQIDSIMKGLLSGICHWIYFETFPWSMRGLALLEPKVVQRGCQEGCWLFFIYFWVYYIIKMYPNNAWTFRSTKILKSFRTFNLRISQHIPSPSTFTHRYFIETQSSN